MGLTERHWFEDEEPKLTENQLEDILWENKKIFERGYQKGFSDGKSTILREQEPRVMMLTEVLENAKKIGLPCWVEDHIENINTAVLFPAVVTSDDIYVQYTGNDYYEGSIYHWAYNKRLRCWTAKPTDEQRLKTKWETLT